MDTLAYEKQLKELPSEKESVLVSYNMKRLKMKKLKDNLLESASQVLPLDRERKDLEKTISDQKERATKAVEERRLRIRLLEDSKHKILIDVARKVSDRQKLKIKYEALAYPKDENGEAHSQAYYIIKAAQKK